MDSVGKPMDSVGKPMAGLLGDGVTEGSGPPAWAQPAMATTRADSNANFPRARVAFIRSAKTGRCALRFHRLVAGAGQNRQ